MSSAFRVSHSSCWTFCFLKNIFLYSTNGDADDSPRTVDTDRLERVVRLCRDLLRSVEILEPGLSLSRGRLLRQMHLPRLQLAREAIRSGRGERKAFVEETRCKREFLNLIQHWIRKFLKFQEGRFRHEDRRQMHGGLWRRRRRERLDATRGYVLAQNQSSFLHTLYFPLLKFGC